MHPLHPYAYEELAEAHRQDLLRSAAAYNAHRAAIRRARRTRPAWRQRIGWTLVEIGLQLTAGGYRTPSKHNATGRPLQSHPAHQDRPPHQPR